MALFQKKQALSQSGTREKLEKMPPAKEEKKEVPPFGRKGYFERGETGRVFNKDVLYNKYSIKGKDADELIKRATNYKSYGKLFEEKDARDLKKELEGERNETRGTHRGFELDKQIKFLKDRFKV